MLSFSDPISKISEIKPYQAKKLSVLGIFTVEDLLYHFPHRYDDFSSFKKIEQITAGETITVQGIVESVKSSRTWKKRMTITEAFINDGTTSIKAVWFNSPIPTKYLTKGKYVQMSGKVALDKKNTLHFQHPNFEFISKTQFEESLKFSETSENSEEKDTMINSNINHSINTGNLTPIYPETQGINSYFLRRIIKKVLTKTNLEEFLPSDILQTQKLLHLEEALEQIHFPTSTKQAEQAKKRFAFEKMFLLQLKTLNAKKQWEKNKAVKVPFDQKFIKAFVSSLPFTLTAAQKKSAWQIIQDLERSTPMNRLLEGDVGSGKTVVAAMAMMSVAHHKHQAALLAPTEVLASQHHAGLYKTFKTAGISCALMTSAQSKLNGEKVKKTLLKKRIAEGKVDVVIGTHALLQKDVVFKLLALVIIDEQHRFGVAQRAHLQKQADDLDDGSIKTTPHLLTMTATPIPRTLSLALLGNLELSIIDESPKGRKKIVTKVIAPQGREQIYSFIKNEISDGRQAFIIYPLVEESSKMSELKAATEEHERLQKTIFPNYKLGLLHGRMKPKEKEEMMIAFKNKAFDILVSTSVVEVGVDVPNATIMVIEGAERFGLSQLHQFRGRVGRDKHQSYCFLFTSDTAADTTTRLRAMERTNNGFKLAEEDMKLRGPGQFLGTLQSGLPDIAMEALSDIKAIQRARICAQQIFSISKDLKRFPLLAGKILNIQSRVHWE